MAHLIFAVASFMMLVVQALAEREHAVPVPEDVDEDVDDEDLLCELRHSLLQRQIACADGVATVATDGVQLAARAGEQASAGAATAPAAKAAAQVSATAPQRSADGSRGTADPVEANATASQTNADGSRGTADPAEATAKANSENEHQGAAEPPARLEVAAPQRKEPAETGAEHYDSIGKTILAMETKLAKRMSRWAPDPQKEIQEVEAAAGYDRAPLISELVTRWDGSMAQTVGLCLVALPMVLLLVLLAAVGKETSSRGKGAYESCIHRTSRVANPQKAPVPVQPREWDESAPFSERAMLFGAAALNGAH